MQHNSSYSFVSWKQQCKHIKQCIVQALSVNLLCITHAEAACLSYRFQGNSNLFFNVHGSHDSHEHFDDLSPSLITQLSKTMNSSLGAAGDQQDEYEASFQLSTNLSCTLRYLDVAQNTLSGTLPHTLGYSSALRIINTANNSIWGR
jgi:hypothetical protein